MNLFELFVKIGVDDQASSKLGNITSKLGGGLKAAAKVGTAAIGAATTAIGALTKQAVENYAEYEQLVGGVETLFKDSALKVQGYADRAYETAGLSANAYMETVTSFSASLLQSLEGDTEAAAEKADLAITDMADNANKMGSSIETLQTAYAGFAKGQFMLLDNLKLGYGGTKEEMERLLEDAEAISDIEYDISSYADVVDAIHVIQTEMGITGTTAKEASTTISGSVASMKASWENLITAIASGDGWDLEVYINNFVDTVETAANNILPIVETTLVGAGKLVDTLIPIIIDKVPSIIETMLPKILESGVKIIQEILEGISKDPDRIVDTVFEVIDILIDAIVDNLPQILSTGALLLGKFAIGIINAIPDLVRRIPEIIRAIKDEFSSHSGEFSSIGDEIVNGVWTGISNAISWFTDKVSSFFSGIVDSVKSTLGIASPSKVFKQIGSFMAQGLGVGWDDEIGDIQDDINGSLDFGGNLVSASSLGSGVGGRPINITQNIYSQKKSAAQIMQEARWQAQMGVLAVV